MHLRGDSQLQKNWTKNEATTKTKQPTHHTSYNAAGTIQNQLMHSKICASPSLGCNYSPPFVQVNNLIRTCSNGHRDLTDKKNKVVSLLRLTG
jgi:hypothetical protein